MKKVLLALIAPALLPLMAHASESELAKKVKARKATKQQVVDAAQPVEIVEQDKKEQQNDSAVVSAPGAVKLAEAASPVAKPADLGHAAQEKPTLQSLMASLVVLRETCDTERKAEIAARQDLANASKAWEKASDAYSTAQEKLGKAEQIVKGNEDELGKLLSSERAARRAARAKLHTIKSKLLVNPKADVSIQAPLRGQQADAEELIKTLSEKIAEAYRVLGQPEPESPKVEAPKSWLW